MASRKFHQVTVKPAFTGTNSYTAFANADVLFNWTEIPNAAFTAGGGTRLTSITTTVRGAESATQQKLAFELYFSSNPNETALGTVNQTVGTIQHAGSEICGYIPVVSGDYGAGHDVMAIAHTATGDGAIGAVMQARAGTSSLYVAAIARGAFDFGSGVLIDNGSGEDTSDAELSVGTIDATTAFEVGDELYNGGDGTTLGTIKSVIATRIVLNANNADAIGDTVGVEGGSPMIIRFGFEQV